MPYIKNADLPKAVRDALPENVQTIYRNAHNGAGKQYGYANEIRLSKLAWSAVKRDYKQDNTKKWLAREGVNAAVQGEDAKGETHEYTTESWVPIAKEGMDVITRPELAIDDPAQKRYTLSAEAFKAAEGTWLAGNIKINHGGQWVKHEILGEKLEDGFLYAKFDQEVIDELNSAETTGGSIDALITEHDDNSNALSMVGTGYSLTYKGFNPRCTFEMGCAGTKDINAQPVANIPTNKANGGLVTAEKQGYVESQKGGGHKDMADEEDKVVTYTVEQLNERVAGALADQKEADDNALKVAVAEGVETQKTEDKEVIDGLTKEKEASDAIIKAQADAALKERRATFMQRYGAEEGSEVLKQWDAAKTLEDSQILTNQLEFPTQQVAGASSGSAVGSSDNNIQDRMAKLGIPGIEFTEGK